MGADVADLMAVERRAGEMAPFVRATEHGVSNAGALIVWTLDGIMVAVATPNRISAAIRRITRGAASRTTFTSRARRQDRGAPRQGAAKE